MKCRNKAQTVAKHGNIVNCVDCPSLSSKDDCGGRFTVCGNTVPVEFGEEVKPMEINTKHKCPKCLIEERRQCVKFGGNVSRVDKKLSIVCNAAPYAPCSTDPCCCGATWIPEKETP